MLHLKGTIPQGFSSTRCIKQNRFSEIWKFSDLSDHRQIVDLALKNEKLITKPTLWLLGVRIVNLATIPFTSCSQTLAPILKT